MTSHDNKYCTELDSHANMACVGQHSYIVGNTRKSADVTPFSPDYAALSNVPIVDAVLVYDFPYTGTVSLLLVKNALQIPLMSNNLLPHSSF